MQEGWQGWEQKDKEGGKKKHKKGESVEKDGTQVEQPPTIAPVEPTSHDDAGEGSEIGMRVGEQGPVVDKGQRPKRMKKKDNSKEPPEKKETSLEQCSDAVVSVFMLRCANHFFDPYVPALGRGASWICSCFSFMDGVARFLIGSLSFCCLLRPCN